MEKFCQLRAYLEKSNRPFLTLSFEEIEKIINCKLCKSAYTYRAYWIPSKTHTMPNTIMEAGYRVDSVDMIGKRITLVQE